MHTIKPLDEQAILTEGEPGLVVTCEAHSVHGGLGAAAAVAEHHRSLLLAGIAEVKGDFVQGDVVDILSADGVRVARGFASYSADQLRALKAQGSAARPAVHIDNMVVSTAL